MEKNEKGISLIAYVITLIIMLIIIGGLLFVIFQKKEDTTVENKNTLTNTNENVEIKQNNVKKEEKNANNVVKEKQKEKDDTTIAENELLSGNVSTTQVYKCDRLDNLGTPQYIIFDGNRCFIGEYEDMANEGTIILGTYKIDSDNVITINEYITETQEYGFFSAATMKLENNRIVLDDGNEIAYYDRIEY